MPRKLRIEYPGAMYHVMNRRDQREGIFRDGGDRLKFLSTLGEACAKAEWQVHAYCLVRTRRRNNPSLRWLAAARGCGKVRHSSWIGNRWRGQMWPLEDSRRAVGVAVRVDRQSGGLDITEKFNGQRPA
ncbi:MAG: hypothetical protein NT154_04930 [Verrucomicrobia bacterium]|nr:hypothetical protein [Verrucomicrobiota bacterium]